ncbi:unnamed protein product [Urochloa humidicola]
MIGWRGTSDGCVHGGCCIAPRRAGCFGSSVSSFNSCRGAGGRKRDPKTFQGMFGCCVPGSTIPRHSKSNKQVVGDLKQISSRLMHEDLLLCVLG